MDRRKFIKTGLAATALAALNIPFLKGAESSSEAATEAGLDNLTVEPTPTKDIKIRFLGTGAADWKQPNENGEYRRLTSILIDDKILIDFTPTDRDMLPKRCKPKTIFYTHSHKDHYNPQAALKLGIKTAYLGETWAAKAQKAFGDSVEVRPLKVGQSVRVEDMVITALPANHVTNFTEQTLIYLIEKGDNRVLYATDTGGLTGAAARMAGIDRHREGRPITGFIMEATMGMGHDEDYRIFCHSSVETVLRTAHVLLKTNRYTPAPGQKVYITHMSRKLHGTQKELDEQLPEPLRAAYDGLEVIFEAK